MKKIVALIIVFAAVFSLCACGAAGGPKGKYVDPETGASITFDGRKAVFEGTDGVKEYPYKMDGDTIVITLTKGKKATFCSYNEEEDTVYINIEDGSQVSFFKTEE
ncbi:MAG: hypothetical protein IJK34_06805 [Clostridia bacterium]|nr:hypothetical protein [Clostridia bacterium]